MTSPSSSANPFGDGRPELPPGAPNTPIPATTGQEAYNIVSDTVTGVNVRKSDNLFQLKVILACVLVGSPIGAIAGGVLADAKNRLIAAIGGGLGMGFVGVVLGLFGSGIYLMIYRAVQHMKGKHD